MKRIISLFLTICLMVGIVGALSVQAVDNFEEEYGISYNDLFMKYPSYLRNVTSEEIIRNATDAYNDVIAKYDKNDELISALKSGASEGLDVIIKNIGSALGLTDSYYEECMDKATMAFMQEVYSDEDSISDLAFVKESAKQFKWIKTATDLSTASIDIAASNMKNLSRDQVETITKTIKGNYGKVLDPATDMVDLAKYIYTACVIEDVQIELIDLLLEKTDNKGELYKGLTRLRNDMTGGIAQYTLSAFIENKLLSEISSTIMKFGWNALDISTGSLVIGKLIMKTAVWVLFDVIFPHPDADTTISNMILTAYVNEICVVLINQRSMFDSPFFVSDMEDYRTLYTMYLSCINATMDSAMALAETTGDEVALSNAKNTFNVALPDFDTYISYCMDVLSTTPVDDRVQRTLTTSDYIIVSSGTVIVGSFSEDVVYTDVLPLTSDNSTFWDVHVSYGNLISGDNVVIPELQVYSTGTLDIQGTLNIEYNLQQNGIIELNDGKILVGCNYTNYGILKMESASSYILVNGNYTQKSNSRFDGSEYKYLIAGTLEVKGNLECHDYYRPSGTHNTILSGDNLQYVDNCIFNILELRNTSKEGISFNSYCYVVKELYSIIGSSVSNGSNLMLTASATIRDNVVYNDIGICDWTATEENEFKGNVHLSWIGVSNINAPQTIKGDFIHNGKLTLNKSMLVVEGNYFNDGILFMENSDDHIIVFKNYSESNSTSSISKMSAGILEVKGDVKKIVDASGTHKTVLSGESGQNIYGGYYNILEILNTSDEGITVSPYTTVKINILQPIKSHIKSSNYLYINGIAAFKDYGELNSDINLYNKNAENVIPTYVDYDNYLSGNNGYVVANRAISDTNFSCELYFDNSYAEQSAKAIIAFYDGDGRLIQFMPKDITVKPGKVDLSIDYEKKAYATYKLMIWENFDTIKPITPVK